MFFRKKKAKPEAKPEVKSEAKPDAKKPQEDKLTPKLEIKGMKKEPEKKPVVVATPPLPFTTTPSCPKCSLEKKPPKPKYCKGKRWVRKDCKHGLRVEHLHYSCNCGYAWNQECQPSGLKKTESLKDCVLPTPVMIPPPPRQLTEFEIADENLRKFFEEELRAGPGFYAELKRLMYGSENLPAGMFSYDYGQRDGGHYSQPQTLGEEIALLFKKKAKPGSDPQT